MQPKMPLMRLRPHADPRALKEEPLDEFSALRRGSAVLLQDEVAVAQPSEIDETTRRSPHNDPVSAAPFSQGSNLADLTAFIDPFTQSTRFLPMITCEVPPARDAAHSELEVDPEGTRFLRAEKCEAKEAHGISNEFFANLSREQCVWFQLPKAEHGGPPIDSFHPGKIGKLRVHKSGRAELELGGVVHNAYPESTDSRTRIAQCLIAMLSSGEEGNFTAFELGPVAEKVVCVPKV